MLLGRAYLELVIQSLKAVKWDMRFFKHYYTGEYESPKSNALAGLMPLARFDDVAGLADKQQTIYLFSEVLTKGHFFTRFEDNRFILNISHNRLTFRFPHLFIGNSETCLPLFNTRFEPIREFRILVENMIASIKDSDTYLLRRANIRIFGVEFRRFRPSFDTFFLADSTLFEVYHTKYFSSGIQMPAYIEKLADCTGFSGIECKKNGDYVFIQWIKSDYKNCDYYAHDLAALLSKRHVWLSTLDPIPKSGNFNVYGDVQFTQIVPVKPGNVFVMNGDTAFIEMGISEANVYAVETRKLLYTKIEELLAGKKIKKINVIVANRNAAFLLFNQSLCCIDERLRRYDIDYEINSRIFYRDDKHNLWSLPQSGKWLNNAAGVMVSIPVADIGKYRGFDLTQSANYITVCSYSIITCFKQYGGKYIPVWMVYNGMHMHVYGIKEAENIVEASEGFMDLTSFEIELLTGKIISYGENEYMESIKLTEFPFQGTSQFQR